MKKIKHIELVHPLSSADIAELRAYSLGFRIQKLRLCADLKQVEFAKLFGVQQTTVVTWENDEHIPRNHVLNKMQMLFDLPMDFFLDAEISRVKLRTKRSRENYVAIQQKIEYVILKRIIDHTYPVGSELASSKAFAIEFNTSQGSVFMAFSLLKDADILIKRKGKQHIISYNAVDLAKKEIEQYLDKNMDI